MIKAVWDIHLYHTACLTASQPAIDREISSTAVTLTKYCSRKFQTIFSGYKANET